MVSESPTSANFAVATAKLRRARDVVARDLDSDSDDLTLDLDGDFELSIAEVKQ